MRRPGLLLAVLREHHKGSLLVLTADDVDSLQLQLDLAAFGAPSHVLPREELARPLDPRFRAPLAQPPQTARAAQLPTYGLPAARIA